MKLEDPLAVVEAALSGDRRAFDRLALALLPVLRARAVRILRRRLRAFDQADVDDAVQDAWLTLLADDGRRLRGWDPERGASFINYVGLVAQRLVANELDKTFAQRRGGGVRPASLDDAPMARAADDPERDAGFSRRLDGLCPCLHEGSSRRDLIIARMLHQDGLSAVEVAHTLGCSRGAVDMANHRFKRALQDCLEGPGAG